MATLAQICEQLYMPLSKDTLCLEWMVQTIAYCSMFHKKYPPTSRRYKVSLNKWMDSKTFVTYPRANWTEYWQFQPDHLLLSECNDLLATYSKSYKDQEDMIVRYMAETAEVELIKEFQILLVNMMLWLMLFGVFFYAYRDFWKRFRRLSGMTMQQIVYHVIRGHRLPYDLIINDYPTMPNVIHECLGKKTEEDSLIPYWNPCLIVPMESQMDFCDMIIKHKKSKKPFQKGRWSATKKEFITKAHYETIRRLMGSLGFKFATQRGSFRFIVVGQEHKWPESDYEPIKKMVSKILKEKPDPSKMHPPIPDSWRLYAY